MSAYSDLRDVAEEHEKMRAHLSPDQNKELDATYKSGQRWVIVGYGVFALMVLALIALAMS